VVLDRPAEGRVRLSFDNWVALGLFAAGHLAATVSAVLLMWRDVEVIKERTNQAAAATQRHEKDIRELRSVVLHQANHQENFEP